MSEKTDALTLLGELRKSRSVLRRIETYYDERFGGHPVPETIENGIILAEILGNYYTCLETMFLRISQYFENSLPRGQWHKELLHKMSLEIPRLRPRLLSDESAAELDELLRFRHFRRYYLEFDYDWHRLRFVEEAFVRVRFRLQGELDACERFLLEAAEALSEGE
jgi:hypothetical protein